MAYSDNTKTAPYSHMILSLLSLLALANYDAVLVIKAVCYAILYLFVPNILLSKHFELFTPLPTSLHVHIY